METTSLLAPPLIAPDAEDAPTTGRKSARSPRVELITRGERRRIWTPEQKREIVMESLGSALTPTEVARKYAINTGLLYTWRRQVLGGQMTRLVCSTPSFAQVEMTPPAAQPQAREAGPEAAGPETPIAPPAPVMPVRPEGLIEIVLPDGVTLRVDAGVNAYALRRVLDAVAGR
jgi:transposase